MRALNLVLFFCALSLALPNAAIAAPNSDSADAPRAKAKRAKTKRVSTTQAKSKRAKAKRTKAKRTKAQRSSTTQAKSKRAKSKRAKAKRSKTARAKAKRANTKREAAKKHNRAQAKRTKKATKKRRAVASTKRATAQHPAAATSSPRRANRKSTSRAKEKLSRVRRGRPAVGAPSSTPAAPLGPKAARLVAAAQRYLGYRYRLGGRGADGTFDCSGLVHRVYQDAGLAVARTARAQAAAGQAVALARARPGDVVYFGSPIHHTGIVLENANGVLKMIHASSSRGVVVTTITTSAYWQARLRGVRRYA